MLIDAIKRSMGPMGMTAFSNEALIVGYVLELCSSKGIISKVDTNFSIYEYGIPVISTFKNKSPRWPSGVIFPILFSRSLLPSFTPGGTTTLTRRFLNPQGMFTSLLVPVKASKDVIAIVP